MRVGDFSVEVIGAGGGTIQELDSGHVAARPGQVYVLRLHNHGPLRCVAEVSIDGNSVTRNGLVIDPWSTVDLERPIHATERGRFGASCLTWHTGSRSMSRASLARSSRCQRPGRPPPSLVQHLRDVQWRRPTGRP